MIYCAKCVTPSTRPNVVVGRDGVCNACANAAEKRDIDWRRREAAFRKVVAHAKSKSRGYDALVPVSGGKDSTWQVAKCLEHGLNVLAVTWKTPARTALGQRNLENLIRLGVDHIDYQVNPNVERKFLLESFKKYGSTAIPMHMALIAIPLTIAARFSIPLVVWGENAAFEYGGSNEEKRGFQMDKAWIARFGVTHGTTAADWVGRTLSAKEMTPYFAPTENELRRAGVLAVFLGYYFPWDPEESLRVARRLGFQARKEGPKTGYYNFADIDDDFISIHHYLKWHKFGFTRLFDNLCIEIRNGRMTRARAVGIIASSGDQTPREDIAAFCRFVGLTPNAFHRIADRFRNKAIWTSSGGIWRMKDFLIKDWRWNEIHRK
ncbi:MAG: N-acetyl sugar amidotransferase [Elusimicrobia bacterium]|nr:N-acetyl sugar amidotransferase [Elusimicrobiota bacterium]